ncbi:MAG TPA: hypothetical protein VF748_16100 [Candidatus Acidoferrum sp.]
MPNFGVLGQGTTLLALATQTTSGTSAAITLPPASSYRLIWQVNSVSGTTPTLVGIVAATADGGTTYNEVLSTTTITTTGTGAQMMIRPYLGIGDAATTAATTLLGVADLAANVVNNGPFLATAGQIKLRWVLTGTTPSFAFQVQLFAVPQDLSD